jgi:hypothetical protein
MGTCTETTIDAFRQATGIQPPGGREAELLREMSDKAFELIKVIQLELSGIRDGDGYWHGSDVMGGMTAELVNIINVYRNWHDGPEGLGF